MDEFEEKRLTIPLDENEENVLFIRLQTNDTFTVVRSFAIIFTSKIKEKKVPIIKIDGSEQEKVHVHHYYKKPPKKEYHNRPIEFRTIDYYSDNINEKWRWYLAQYNENYI